MNKELRKFKKDLLKSINDKRIVLSLTLYANQENYGYTLGVYFESYKLEYLGCINLLTENYDLYDHYDKALNFIKSVHPTRYKDAIKC